MAIYSQYPHHDWAHYTAKDSYRYDDDGGKRRNAARFLRYPHSDRGGDGFRLERGDQRLVGSHQFTDNDYAYDSDNGPDKYGSQDRNDISL